MAKLWFQNSNQEEKLIGDYNTLTEVYDAIDDYIDKCNENKPANKRFISYYKRCWNENGRLAIDVGSWSEFFYWENQITEVTIKEDGKGEFNYE